MKRAVFFLIIICLFFLCSCAALEVRTHEVLLPLTDVYQEGSILIYKHKDTPNLSENDIGIEIQYHQKLEQFYSIIKFNINKTDEIGTTVHNYGNEYKVRFKYIYDGGSTNPYSITTKIKQKGYKIKTVDPVTIAYSGLKTDAEVSKFQLPIEVTFFKINSKKFTLVASIFPYTKATGLDVFMVKDQKFFIVDEKGNVYASFTKDRYELNAQPDSNKYNFIPIIASYSVIRQIVLGAKL